MKEQARTLNRDRIQLYEKALREREKSAATIRQYCRCLVSLRDYLRGSGVSKAVLIAWKQELSARYSAATVNVMLAAVNGFLDFCGWNDCRMKPLRIQREMFCREERELTGREYTRLVNAAGRKKNKRLCLVLQTICATGIRVSELRFITAEAVSSGRAAVCCKGKRRTVFLPKKLCCLLRSYLEKEKRTKGAVFVTKSGNHLDRSNIWREMKHLCAEARVEAEKIFPHNLRHLFARTYYSLEKDLSRLSDILGHSNVNTTRVYTVESGKVHRKQLERMSLVITT